MTQQPLIRRPNRRGFSLLEAMITLVIMLVIIGGATALFFENQNATAHVALAELRPTCALPWIRCPPTCGWWAYTKWAPLQVLNGRISSTSWSAPTPSGSSSASNGPLRRLRLHHPRPDRVVEPDIINDAQLRDEYSPPIPVQGGEDQRSPFQEGDLLLITNAPTVDNPWDPGAQVFADLFVPTTIQGPQSGNPFTEVTFNAGANGRTA